MKTKKKANKPTTIGGYLILAALLPGAFYAYQKIQGVQAGWGGRPGAIARSESMATLSVAAAVVLVVAGIVLLIVGAMSRPNVKDDGS